MDANWYKAVEARLLEYQRAFKEENAAFTENWHYVPKGVSKYVYCQFSKYVIKNDGRIAMLVSGLPSAELNHNLKLNLTLMLSDYSIDGQFISGNPPFLEAVGHQITHLQDLVVEPSALKTIHRSLSQSGRYEDDVLMNGILGGRWYHLVVVKVSDDDEKQKILIHQYDIHRRKMNEVALSKEVLTDTLTGLLNRRGLDKKLEELASNNTPFVLYYIDLDGFKTINDTFGHGIGDQVLQTVADRLLNNLPENSSVCRFGGDEFVVIVQLSDLLIDKAALASALVKSLSDTYYDRSRPMALSASIGLAQYPSDADKITSVVFCADAAMYQAKQLGKHRWINYEAGMEQILLRQSVISQNLSYAQSNSELQLYYQPIWEYSTNNKVKIISFEASLRWHSSDLGIVSAQEVMHVAEEIGILNTIERWIAEQAISDLLILREYMNPDITMSINLSGIHLRDAILPGFLLDTLASKKLAPKDLTVELSERALVEDIKDNENINSSRGVVAQLVEKGFNVIIDDFGKGYSSLAYLHRTQAVMAKIDCSFIEQIERGHKTLRHIQRLIEAHGMQVLVLGVETERQKDMLLNYGIALYQGHFLGCPQPLDYYIQ